jgi:hypothetical protein
MRFRFQPGGKGQRPQSARPLLVVCLVLVALLAVMQIPHLHQTPSDAEHCALCVVMHSAAPVAVAAVAIVLVQLGISIPIVKARAIVRYWHPQLFTRPPPRLQA